jgi:hypothetical protein
MGIDEARYDHRAREIDVDGLPLPGPSVDNSTGFDLKRRMTDGLRFLRKQPGRQICGHGYFRAKRLPGSRRTLPVSSIMSNVLLISETGSAVAVTRSSTRAPSMPRACHSCNCTGERFAGGSVGTAGFAARAGAVLSERN